MKVEQKLDRFENLASNLGNHNYEIFAEQGLDYQKLEESVLENVEKLEPNFREASILDVGIGDGETSLPFVRAGCKKIVGIDLNEELLMTAREKLGDSVSLVKMDATNMGFEPGKFKIVIAGLTIHNIPKVDRVKLWQEILRLSPEIIVFAEKIAELDQEKHQAQYNSHIEATKKVLGGKYGLHQMVKDWVAHYEEDEKERLEMGEIEENLGSRYSIEVVLEMGMNKTVVAIKKF